MNWLGGHNTYLAEWGEYERCSGWTFSRALMRSVTSEYDASCLGAHRSDITVAAHLRIHGRPSSFTLYVAVNHDVMLTYESTCRSLRQAKERADEWLAASDRVEEALRAWYAKARQLVSREGEEFVGFFSESSEVFMLLDWGHYTYDKWKIERFGSGYHMSCGRTEAVSQP